MRVNGCTHSYTTHVSSTGLTVDNDGGGTLSRGVSTRVTTRVTRDNGVKGHCTGGGLAVSHRRPHSDTISRYKSCTIRTSPFNGDPKSVDSAGDGVRGTSRGWHHRLFFNGLPGRTDSCGGKRGVIRDRLHCGV